MTLERQAAAMGAEPLRNPAETFTCPACGHEAPWPPGPPPRESIFRCDECRTRVAYGVAMPRVTVTPDETDPRFVLLVFETIHAGSKAAVVHRVDRAYGANILHNLQSISR